MGMKTSGIIWLAGSIFFTMFAWGQQPVNPVAPVLGNELTPDVRVVIDISGSMKKNDPNYLRRPALELLIQLFPEGSKAGVWTFGQWVNNLVSSNTVNTAWRTNASAQVEKISSVALRTNIPAALEKAMADVKSIGTDYSIHLILLTDGMVDVSLSTTDNETARQRIVAEILPALKDAGVTIHTVALSQNADLELMELLAAETGGFSAVAETAEDLSRIFVQAFDAAAPAEQLPIEGNTFYVDASVEEFTTLVFKKDPLSDASLLSPAGKKYSFEQHPADIKWLRQHNYELITVKSPLMGEWTIEAELEPESRVTVISNLNLKVAALKKGQFISDSATITAVLYDQGQALVKPELLNLIDMSASVTRRDDKQQWLVSLSEIDPIPDNGVYTTELNVFQQAGVYDILIIANGKTFQRQQAQTIAVRERYDIRAASTGSDPLRHTIKLYARNTAINSAATAVTAHITTPTNIVKTMSVEGVSERRWRLELPQMEQAGIVKVAFELEGVFSDGSRLAERTQTIEVEHRNEGQQPLPEPQNPAVASDLNNVDEQTIEEASAPIIERQPDPVTEEPIALVTVADQSASDNIDWKTVLMYVGIGFAQIVAIGLMYFGYKAISASRSKSAVLSADDDLGDLAPVVNDTPTVEPGNDSPIAAAIMSVSVALEAPELPVFEESANDLRNQSADQRQGDEQPETGSDTDDDELTDSDFEIDSGALDKRIETPPEGSLDVDLDDAFDLPDDAIDIDADTENDR